MKQIPALMTWHCVLFFFYLSHSWMREEYVHAIYVLGCGIPWWTPRGALLIECSEQNAMSMPSLGVNVVSIGASILMSS